MVQIPTQKLLPWAPLVIRVALGVIFIAHGGQKLFGLCGGVGLQATFDTFASNMGIPPWITFMAVLAEFFGGLAVLIGLLTRLASVSLGVVMLVAIFEAHLQYGFFMNWSLVRGVGHGIEFNIALLGMSLGLILSGPGQLSLDRLLGIEKN
jgi:putative oxidoreductase